MPFYPDSKKEEYRNNNDYWTTRINNEKKRQQSPDGNGMKLILQNGYRKDAPRIMITLSGISIGPGSIWWGADHGKEYIVLHIEKVECV